MESVADPQITHRVLNETSCEAHALAEFLADIRITKRSGVLVVNFSQGSPAGKVKFTEPRKE